MTGPFVPGPAGEDSNRISGDVAMSEVDSTAPSHADKTSKPASGLQPLTTAAKKPSKPRPDFPLTPHRAGYWCKKIRGVVYYFGPQSKTPEFAGLVFLSQRGTPCISVRPPESEKDPAVNRTDTIAVQVPRLLKELEINGRKGLGFYTIRHVIRTVADGAKDQPAVDFTMGHEVSYLSSVYREIIDDERLLAVVNHVRAWLFGSWRAMTIARKNSLPAASTS
jgi:hypothetical protein